jgi:hypothetical protein
VRIGGADRISVKGRSEAVDVVEVIDVEDPGG